MQKIAFQGFPPPRTPLGPAFGRLLCPISLIFKYRKLEGLIKIVTTIKIRNNKLIMIVWRIYGQEYMVISISRFGFEAKEN